MNDYSVQKQLKRHYAGTVQSQGGRVRNVKQVGFEPGPEDSYGRCGIDKIRQFSLGRESVYVNITLIQIFMGSLDRGVI